MNNYFSRLIQQTGINLDEKGPSRSHRTQPSENQTADAQHHSVRPESLEIEEIIEVTAPSGSRASGHHQKAGKAAEDNQKINVDIKNRKTSGFLKNAGQNNTQTGSHALAPLIDQTPEQHNFQQNSPAKFDNSKQSKSIPAPEQNYDDSTKNETASASLQTEIEQSIVTETGDSASPASIEQHVYISQLPDAYQKAIKEWLISPTNGSKKKTILKEDLKKAIQRKQHSTVVLKPEQHVEDAFVQINTENEQFKTGNLHLSVGNINLTIEEPKTVKQQAPQATNKPASRQSTGSSRLSRHYLRIR